jgi:asparagine synthase (glutamine-hydrolysing)
MCGIAGFLSSALPPGDEARAIVTAMTDVIEHRGPDANRPYVAPLASGGAGAMGHPPLTINDREGGVQPMPWLGWRLMITFIGEIYNFRELRAELEADGARFGSSSDTEVILAAYAKHGAACVEKLRGMFAFALWDADKQRLLLARDRFGKKPLYYAETADAFVFGSEAKCLLEYPGVSPGVDHAAVWDYFAFRYVPGPRTLFEGIEKVPPGSVLIREQGRSRIERYYTPPDALPRHGPPLEGREAVARTAAALDDAVKARLVSDVPFGAFLSGGIDSSVIVALMSRHLGEPVKTFSVSFEEEQYSEARYSELVARRFGTSHHELVVRSRELIDHLPSLVRLRDAPVAEPSDIPIYLLSRDARRHVKMVLTGEGSDEVFGGYPKHVYERFSGCFRVVPKALRQGLLLPLIDRLPYGFRRIKTAASALTIADWNERMQRWFGALDDSGRRSLLREEGASLEKSILSPLPDPSNSPLKRILAFDQLSWLPDNLLERGDRMTMGASLEARMPFLDHELADVAASLPDHLRIAGFKTKAVLRDIARELLPEVIVTRPKVGFRVPVNVWFQTDLKPYIEDMLLSASAKTRDYYRRPALERVVDEHVRGRQNHEKLIWTMLNLELWHREYA